MGQCKGTTSKGQRCKINVSDSTHYCHYHIPQSTTKKHIIPTPLRHANHHPKTNKAGFIYLYTLAHLLPSSTDKHEWLQIHKYGAQSLKSFNPRNNILVKVGCTTTSVTHRLRQWESQCQHKLTLVNPYNTKETLDTMSNFLRQFSTLSITPNYKNFKFDDLGFRCDKDVLKIESKIHEILRLLYGYGTVHCGGCKGVDGKFKLHVEWFLIPRRDIDKVFRIIDKVISGTK